MRPSHLLGILLSVLIGVGLGTVAPAASQSDQERARDERSEGRILSYDVIVARATERVPGRVVGQSLDRLNGDRYVYRLRILQRGGKVASVSVDAHTGRIISIRGRR